MPKTVSLPRRLLITSFVAIGVASAWYMAGNWLVGIIQTAMERREPFENVYLTVKGEPVLVRTTNGNTQTTDKILNLAGEPVDLSSQDLLYPQTMSGLPRKPLPNSTPEWQSRLAAANDGGVPPHYWYMVHDGQQPGHAYGVGFHAVTRTVIGYFGRRGFTDQLLAKDEWFEIGGNNGIQGATTTPFYGQEPRWTMAVPRFLLLADGKLWRIDLAKKSVSQLLDCPQAYQLGQAWKIRESQPVPPVDADRQYATSITPLYGFLREPDGVVFVSPSTGEHTRYPLPAALRTQLIGGAVLPDGVLVVISQRDWSDEDEQILWVRPSGEIAKQQTVRRKARQRGPSLAALGWQAAFAGPLPLVNAAYTIVGAPEIVLQNEETDDYTKALAIVLRRTWPSVLTVLALGCGTAILAYRRQRRFGLSNAGVWAVFAFLFGIAGWIAYRFHRPWPVLEECPACHQPAPRDREACLDCGAVFPPPPLKGIEVFA